MPHNGLELSRSAARASPLHSRTSWQAGRNSIFASQPSRLRRVALGGHPPKAPTDPHERISRMRFFKSWFRCIT